MTNKEMIKANVRIRELEAENKDLLDELEVVNQKKISNWLKVKELEYEIDKLSANMTSMFHQDRANRLAVVADALASECKEHKARTERAEAKLQELYNYIKEHSKDLPVEYSQLVDEHFWELGPSLKTINRRR